MIGAAFVFTFVLGCAGIAYFLRYGPRTTPLVKVRDFAALRVRTEEDQRQVLREAQEGAFRGSRALLAILPMPLAAAISSTTGYSLHLEAIHFEQPWHGDAVAAFVCGGICLVVTLLARQLLKAYVGFYVERVSAARVVSE